MTPQPGEKTIAIHILPNICRSKGNSHWNLVSQYNLTWETFFLKNHAQNIVEKLFPDPFLQKSKLSLSLDQ